MAFSSNFFIFAFLPSVLALYFLVPQFLRNAVLLVAGLIFYAFDTGYLAWLLVCSIVLNHLLANIIINLQSVKYRRLFLATGIVANLIPLFHFKYAGFASSALSSIGSSFGIHIAPGVPPELPIGISFFTFQAISYIVDVYTKTIEPAKSLVNFGAYHALFPQLIAGPIVRYVEVKKELYGERGSLREFADGVFRFCIGLAKKIIIADQLGVIADRVFDLPGNELSAPVAWLGLLCYTLQIYYDFSGYSDMAIGLGRMLGFTFPENFDQPYRSRSITEFWRRWHMTLSRWFRDYVYVPLGGNRSGASRTYVNLFVVFFLCGLWHGAGYTFIVWGLYHGTLLVAERLYKNHIGALPRSWPMWLVTGLFVMVGWVFFRCNTMMEARHFLATMSGWSNPQVVYYGFSSYLNLHSFVFLCAGIFFAVVPFESFQLALGNERAKASTHAILAIFLFAYSIVLLSAHSFNPFIYFRF